MKLRYFFVTILIIGLSLGVWVYLAYASDSGALSPGTMADDTTVGTVAWTNPDNAKTSNNVYATRTPSGMSETTHYLKATNLSFSIPSGATINGILVEIQRKAPHQSAPQHVNDSTVKIVKSNGTFGSTNKADISTPWPTSETYASYGSSSDLWGETWTTADINDIDFGVGISALITDSVDSSTIASVDHIRITVYYNQPQMSPGTMADDATVGTVAWTNPDNAKTSNNVYATFTSACGAQSENSIKIVKGGTIVGNEKSTGAALDASDTYRSYGGSSDLWGTTLTPSDINDSTFGVVFSVNSTIGGSGCP